LTLTEPRVGSRIPTFDRLSVGARDVQPPLVLLANRLPVVKTPAGWRPAPGGLVAALQPAFESRRGVWVGWTGHTSGPPRTLPGLGAQLVALPLTRKDVEGHYHGFSNSTLWPLFHSLPDRVTINGRWWHRYRNVNLRFAERATAVASPDAVFWVHDYQLACVPLMLRTLGATQPIGFFLHIPFPARELFTRLPWRDALLEGLLGADVVAFQTEEYRENFLRACLRLRSDATADGAVLRLGDGRSVMTATHPISIDAHGLSAQARSQAVERALERLRAQFAGRRVLVGVDRLDYTKGIVERLRAIELLLEERRDLRGKIAFVQIAVPSRGDIREYRELRSQVEEMVGRMNGRFTQSGEDVPVHYLYRGVSPVRLLAYYRLADVCLVTSLRDGMNLVAKEFVVCQAAGRGTGVLVLTEFAGAAEELREALPCNPFDIEGLACVLARALVLDEDDRRARIEHMSERVAGHDVFAWLGDEMDALHPAPTSIRGSTQDRLQIRAAGTLLAD
jgi:trehalose 6-phosphate synthase